MTVHRRGAAQVLGWLILLAAILWLSLRGWGAFQMGVYQDDAHYLVLARSLAEGGPYGLINEPGQPPSPKHPFGFPLLLAPVVWLFPQELLAGAAVSLAATLINASLLFWGWPLLSPATSRWWGLGVAALYALSPLALGLSHVALSEPTFLSLVLAALLLVEARGGHPQGPLSVALGVVLTFALFTRWLGIALWAAVFLRIAMAGRSARASFAGVLGGSIGSLVLILGLTSIDLRHLLPVEYLAELRTQGEPTNARRRNEKTLADRSLGVASGYVFSDLRRVLVPVGGGKSERALAERMGLPFLPSLAAAILAGLVGLGAWRAWRDRALSASVLLFELFYCGALTLWPWHTERLLYPVQPFLVLQCLLGFQVMADAARRLWRRRPHRPAIPIEVVGVGAALIAVSLFKDLHVVETRAVIRDLRVGATWLAENTPPDSIVMAGHPQAIYLYSGRKTVPLPTRSVAELEQALHGIDYVLVGPALAWRDDGALAYDKRELRVLRALEKMTSERRLTAVYESSPRELVRVYRVEKEPA